ncbi:MAG: tetratricopeptide repeat protein [Sphingomonadaceae bacterium]|nr:tetratricopeptide repeat protein [Sphingomonadaceae bacterium]
MVVEKTEGAAETIVAVGPDEDQAAIAAATIRALIEEGDHAGAAQLLAEARDRFADHPQLALAQGALLEATGKWDEAKALYQSWRDSDARNPQGFAGLSRVAIERGATVVATKFLRKARARGLPRGECELLAARIAGKLDKQVRHSGDAGTSREKRIEWARAALDLHDAPLAQKSAQEVLDADPDNLEALEILGRAEYQLGNIEAAAAVCERLAALEPDNPDWVTYRIGMASTMGDYDGAVAMLREAITAHPDNIDFYRRASKLGLPSDLNEHGMALATKVGPDDAPHRQRIAAAILMQSGKDLPENLTSQYANIFVPPETDLKRPLVEDDGAPMLVARAEGPAPLVIVFTGLADQAQMPVATFDRNLAALGASAIYLRDRSRYIFLQGIPGVAADRDTAIAMLRDLIAEIAPTRLITLGSSSGGHAAIGYGLALGADTIIGFSAASNLTAAFCAADGRGRALIHKLSRLPEDMLDLLPALRSSAKRPDIHLVYGSHHPQDPMHAEYLASDGGVSLYPLDDVVTHPTLAVMASRGDLLPFLTGIVAPETVPS